jgi:hypothetical protein
MPEFGAAEQQPLISRFANHSSREDSMTVKTTNNLGVLLRSYETPCVNPLLF